ncbi:MAG: hypothetical protein HQK49_02480 [Oligoflexia bacterium]|nr:hypothetical protein [Oligoflexia bacterium]
MSTIAIGELPIEFLAKDFSTIREALVKSYSLNAEDTQIRNLEEALLILYSLSDIKKILDSTFKKYPSLMKFFEDEYAPYREYFDRQNIIDISFIEDSLFPERDLFPFVIEGHLDKEILNGYIESFKDWSKDREQIHLESQNFISNNLDKLDKNLIINSELKCFCVQCIADYRNKIREFVYSDCISYLEQIQQQIKELVDKNLAGAGARMEVGATVGVTVGAEESGRDNLLIRISELYSNLQKNIEKRIYAVRGKLKKVSVVKLENQLKNQIKLRFDYSGEIGKIYCQILRPIFDEYLKKNNYPPDLLGDSEYDRFLRQLSTNIFKDKNYILREFSRLVQSVLFLKRKDISSTILQEYLGQFWLHAEARRIKRKIIYHLGPTNSGKTYSAIESLCKAKNGCYLAPLRLLAAELFDTMSDRGVKTTLLTGEEVIEVEGATHYSSTIEMAKLHQQFECAVIDEIQMLSDSQRGWAWTRALINLNAQEVHICGDDTVIELVKKIVEMTGDTLETKSYERLTKLEILNHPIGLGELERGDALIVFSRKNALKYKADSEKLGFKVSIIYGMLGPEVRREQARKFDEGETDIIVSTDAIAMGMNLPIKRIVFSTLTKYIDEKEYRISNSEIKQIAGRSGRYKRFPVGYITCLTRVEDGISEINQAMESELEQKTSAMVGPDLDIFTKVNQALTQNSLPVLSFLEFLHLFNTMVFEYPFYCVDLKEMIELTEIIESANDKYKTLTAAEIFGFACAPVNMGVAEHLQYFIFILNNYIRTVPIKFESIDNDSSNIDYLETAIKCVELYQWLARHFGNKNFDFSTSELMHNKGMAIEKLNILLSEHIIPNCSSCGRQLPSNYSFGICEQCFSKRRFSRGGGSGGGRGRGRDRDPRGGGGEGRASSKATHSKFSKHSKNSKHSKHSNHSNRSNHNKSKYSKFPAR